MGGAVILNPKVHFDPFYEPPVTCRECGRSFRQPGAGDGCYMPNPDGTFTWSPFKYRTEPPGHDCPGPGNPPDP